MIAVLHVLDTTALFNAKDFPVDFEIIVPQGVLDELMAWGLNDRVRLLVGVRIFVEAPGKDSVEKVKQFAEKTGDIDRLSPTDIDVIALALEKSVPLISDDYSIGNTAKILGLKCIPMETRGIKKIYYWKYVCRGCGKEYDRDMGECIICGKELLPKRYKSEDI
ncbi:MAG: hypothetical protein OEV21_03260 [Thermoplasmata archaeon]|nr:hypothetical protein [Thermoplasmata archaeon]